MRRVIAFVLVLTFITVTGIVLADEGEATTAPKSSVPALNNMANRLMSHFPHRESAPAKEATPPLSAEELKVKRQNTGVGMRGIVGNE